MRKGQRCGVGGTVGCRVVERSGVGGSGYVVIVDIVVDVVAAGRGSRRGRYRHGRVV